MRRGGCIWRKRLVLVMAALLALCNLRAWADVHPAVVEAESQRIAVIDRATHSVLAIFAPSGKGGGSGVVISPDGYALTNLHVVEPCGPWLRCGMRDGRLYDAIVVGIDPTGDVALIKLFGRDDFPIAEMADSDQVRPGDDVLAMGNPFLLATDFQPTVTQGIISGVHRYQFPAGTLLEYTDCLQTDAAINPGNSGGPLFDDQGRLIGVNGRCSFEKRGRVSVGVGYAISINQIRNFLGCLHSGRIVDHATLGLRVAADIDGRVVVDEIVPNCDAYRRGLRYGDEILEFAGRTITTPNGLKNVLGIFPDRWQIPLVVRREGQRREVLVRLESLHHEGELANLVDGAPGTPKLDPHKKTPEPKKHPKESPPEALHETATMPEMVQQHYQKRRGYSNYYFNRMHQERVWRSWMSPSDTHSRDRHGAVSLGPTWMLAGRTEGGQSFGFELDDRSVIMELPGGRLTWTADDALGSNLAPPASGGLAVLVHLWRRLAVEGLDRFGEVYYWGTAPFEGQPDPVDVMVGLCGGVECWFYFQGDDGRLLAIEMYPDDETDPCRATFSHHRAIDAHMAPGHMEVHIGRDRYGVFVFEELSFRGASKP